MKKKFQLNNLGVRGEIVDKSVLPESSAAVPTIEPGLQRTPSSGIFSSYHLPDARAVIGGLLEDPSSDVPASRAQTPIGFDSNLPTGRTRPSRGKRQRSGKPW